MTIRISEITQDDLEALADLYQQLIPNEISLVKMESVYQKNKGNDNHFALVAKENGHVVGTLLASITEMYFGQCKSFMGVEDFVVDEKHRGQGIGSSLMDEAETIARKRNCSYIMLITDFDRIESRKFYTRLGYSSQEFCAFKKKL